MRLKIDWLLFTLILTTIQQKQLLNFITFIIKNNESSINYDRLHCQLQRPQG